MYRIGIVGSESSHAMQFAKYFNLPDPERGMLPHPDMRVTCVLGDALSAADTAAQANIPAVCTSLEQMAQQVDAVMITGRRGSEHMAQVQPFLARKLPMFVDKPFTSDLAQAQELARQIGQAGCPVLAGSGCKYCQAVLDMAQLVQQLRSQGKLRSAVVPFTVIPDSIYDGFYFYASHLVEIVMAIFGTDIRQLQAYRAERSVIASLAYPDVTVSAHYVADIWKHSVVLLTTEGMQVLPLDTHDTMTREADRFARVVRGEDPGMQMWELTAPVVLMDAIQRAADEGKTLTLPLLKPLSDKE